MNSSPQRAALLKLVGTWEGTGRGEFPTLEPFEYREVLEIDRGPEAPLLHYRQQTWRDKEGREAGSHAETGFISLDEDDQVKVLNAEGSDRVEVLGGQATMQDGVLVLNLESIVLAHDERMIRSWREIELDGDVLRYTMGMATTRVPEGARHLTARLTRR